MEYGLMALTRGTANDCATGVADWLSLSKATPASALGANAKQRPSL